ncbi:hypothetical protein ABZ379_48815 [Streptomyces canus]|uniref:hypothetical protein n=1 Tax=Streptomyces canus TaxID=58343 RepID=UPI0033D84D47
MQSASAKQAPVAEERRPAAVYRLWAEDGTLLYIGSSYAPEERAKAHSRASWGHLVVRRADEWHPTRRDAYEAEARAIEAEEPTHNLVSTPRYAGQAERGRIRREAADARWRVALAAIRAGTSEGEARRAGGWAEVEYLEATGVTPKVAAKWRGEMERGLTDDARLMTLPQAVDGRLTWEMSRAEIRRAMADSLITEDAPWPNAYRAERLGLART